MREEVANLVHPVLAAGLRLWQRLDDGGEPPLAAEQAALRAKLMNPRASPCPDFVGDGPASGAPPGEGDRFLGGKYALACWLDEVFTLHVRHESTRKYWNEHKLEQALFGSNVRAKKFWEQAELAEGRPGADALEIFYLCVMLGFRGNRRGQPEQLEAWRTAAEARILDSRGVEEPAFRERDPVCDAPPLRGRERLHRALVMACVFVGALIPVATFILAVLL